MAKFLSSLVSFREQLPLPVRMGYGWLRRKFVPHSIWDNEYFKRHYQWLQETQWWSKEQLEELQLEQLQAMVQHAYENVPYYRRVFDDRRLKPSDISTLRDVQKLPLLTKEDVRSNSEDFVARNVAPERLEYYTTGGSTGVPLGVYHDKYTTYPREQAFILRQWSWAGYRFGDRFVTLRDAVINKLEKDGTRAWSTYNSHDNEIVFSSTEMSEENMYKYVELIEKFRPRFIHAFPSSLEVLTKFMRRHGVSDIKVDGIFCSSETLYPRQRELIESQFGCKIFDFYSLTEFVVGLVECGQHEGYHVNMEYGLLELVDKNGDLITETGTLGRIVGTGFGNYCMPLLRYATDDLAVYAAGKCSCRRESTLVAQLKGRLQEFVVSKTGKLVPFLALYDSRATVWAKFREVKFIQEKEGELAIEVARTPSFSESEIAQELLRSQYEVLGEEEFSIKIRFVNRVYRTQRGKLLFLEQKLPIALKDVA
jgi:phenylacetate-CoA ligase